VNVKYREVELKQSALERAGLLRARGLEYALSRDATEGSLLLVAGVLAAIGVLTSVATVAVGIAMM
jgi:hypothetical protein